MDAIEVNPDIPEGLTPAASAQAPVVISPA